MAVSSKSSVLAVVPEVTEGTPVFPSAATQYTAMQDDFEMTPSNSTLENKEKRSSIGKAKPILGEENPTASLSHYLRHSGTAGAAPDYNDLLKAGVGTEVVASNERNTAAGSTVTAVECDAGQGADFQRGQGLLVKHGSAAYEIAVVHSVATDTLTPAFKLQTAPAENTNLGKCVLYKPADSGHQCVSLIEYLGNGGGNQLLTGGRVTELGIQASAGELINMKVAVAGLKHVYNAIEITSSTRYLDWENDDGTFAAAVTAGVYHPHELADAITTAMNTASTGETHACTYNDTTGKFKFTCTGTLLTIEWNTGANTANSIASKIGFSTAADSSGTAATTGYTGSAISWASPYTPTLDSSDPLAAKANVVYMGDHADNSTFHVSEISVTLSNSRALAKSICADTGVQSSRISEREVKVTWKAYLSQYEAQQYRRYKAGTETRFQWAFGTKSGGNWVPGKCGYVYLPTMTITSFKISEDDGVYTVDCEATAYVDSSGNGEFYLGFL